MNQATAGRLMKQAERDSRTQVVCAPWDETQEAEWLKVRAVTKGAPIVEGDPEGDPVDAEVNHSRWVGRCPDCAAAMLLRDQQPGFVCGECLNIANGSKPRPVVWPEEDVEEPLNKRPEPRARNWRPPITVADLVAENTQRGF